MRAALQYGESARLIKAALPIFERLAENDFRLSPELVEAILVKIGET